MSAAAVRAAAAAAIADRDVAVWQGPGCRWDRPRR